VQTRGMISAYVSHLSSVHPRFFSVTAVSGGQLGPAMWAPGNDMRTDRSQNPFGTTLHVKKHVRLTPMKSVEGNEALDGEISI
jgi:hypothetical protein